MRDIMKLYPIKFKPIYKARIWGGRELEKTFDRDLPENEAIGESWELTDLPQDKSVVANGHLAGKTISEILEMYPLEITGNADFKGPFSLMIKILDAQDDLSVQVHPDIETCKKLGEGEPKTECWYIIDKKPGACIYKGLKHGTSKEQFEQAVINGTCANYLVKVPVEIGQCHFLPSGTCHAIGAGLLIAEIQQPSDTTYRVFDWNRIDKNTGKGRELHIEKAIESIHFNQSADELPVASSGRLVDSDLFKVDKVQVRAANPYEISHGTMQVIIIINGSGTIKSHDAQVGDTPFNKGETLLIPASFDGAVITNYETEFLKVTL